jgi:hypothetical protein
MSVTAAQAAKKATGWAEAAEAALVEVDKSRMEAKRSEGARDKEAALQHQAMADGFEMYRDRAVGMATMWARISSALHGTESGGRS